MTTDLLITIDAEGPLPGRLGFGGARPDMIPAQIDPERFTAFAREHARQPRYERAIFIGDGEPLEQHGFGLVAAARGAGFAHVRLHTSARRLTEARQVRAVVLAGVDEFGLNLFGDTPELHDALIGVPGDFAKLMTSFDRLAYHPVQLRVDVVLTRANLDALPRILELAASKRVHHITLWSHNDARESERATIPSLAELLPAVTSAIEQGRALELALTLRHMPACLLGPHAELLDNTAPDAFDGVRPGRPLPEFNCLLEAKCELAESCLGLGHAYVNAHGWELARLQPIPRVRPWVERDRSVETGSVGLDGPRGHAAWLALLGEHASRVANVALTRSEARYPMQMPDGTRFVLVITARDPSAQHFVQSRSFNLAYTDVDGPAAELDIAAFIEPVLATIVTRDDGALSLDSKPRA